MVATDHGTPDLADLIVRNAKVTTLHDGGSLDRQLAELLELLGIKASPVLRAVPLVRQSKLFLRPSRT